MSFRKLADEVSVGDRVLVDDGAMELRVESTGRGRISCRVTRGGVLGGHKGLHLPDTELSLLRCPRSWLQPVWS